MITMPRPAFKGQDVEIFCAFNMENKKLYALKWFKNDVEFYRYIPKEVPAVKVYEAAGVVVNQQNSLGGKVHLTQVTLSTAGDYKCLVSEEKPFFRTKYMVKTLIVYDLPTKPPEIYTSKNRFKAGDEVNFNCTSQPSYPVTDLKWFLNNKQIRERDLVTYPLKNLSDGRYEITKQLSFVITNKDIHNDGELIVECQSSVEQYYNKSSTQIVTIEHVTSRSSTKQQPDVDIQELSGNIFVVQQLSWLPKKECVVMVGVCVSPFLFCCVGDAAFDVLESGFGVLLADSALFGRGCQRGFLGGCQRGKESIGM
ncbi:Cell adhesion molecule 1 [Nymphon striatum]|nr:Cell adhesion molecule 1 [Nymphon striatum]